MNDINPQWYQMDLFDLMESEYVPKKVGFEHYASGVNYFCPKCNMVVGNKIDGEWTMKKDTCRNGHKMKWEE